MPGTQLVPVNCLSDEDIIVDLYVRLVGLCVKSSKNWIRKIVFLIVHTNEGENCMPCVRFFRFLVMISIANFLNRKW